MSSVPPTNSRVSLEWDCVSRFLSIIIFCPKIKVKHITNTCQACPNKTAADEILGFAVCYPWHILVNVNWQITQESLPIGIPPHPWCMWYGTVVYYVYRPLLLLIEDSNSLILHRDLQREGSLKQRKTLHIMRSLAVTNRKPRLRLWIRLYAPFSRLKPWARTGNARAKCHKRLRGQASLSRILTEAVVSKRAIELPEYWWGGSCRDCKHSNESWLFGDWHINPPDQKSYQRVQWQSSIILFSRINKFSWKLYRDVAMSTGLFW